MISAYLSYTYGSQIAEFRVVVPMIDKLRQNDVLGALSLVLSVPILKLLMKIKPEVSRDLLKAILLNPAVRAGTQRSLETVSVAARSPFMMLQEFSDSIDSLGVDQLVDGIQKLEEAFENEAVRFKFPEDLIAKIAEPIFLLQKLCPLIPAPFEEPFAEALSVAQEVAELSALMPMILSLKEFDLEAAIAHVLSAPVLLCLAKLAKKFGEPDLPRTLLQQVFLAEEIQSVVEKASSSVPTVVQGPFLQLKSFCDEVKTEEDVEKLIQSLQEVREAFQDLADGAGEFDFPQHLSKYIQPVDIFKIVGTVIPEPFRSPFMDALDHISDLVILVPVINKIKSKDLKGALLLVPTLPVFNLLAKLAPDMVSHVAHSIFAIQEVQAGIVGIMATVPEASRGPFLDLQSFSRNAKDMAAEDLCASLSRISKSFEDLGDEAAVKFKFPDDLFSGIDDPLDILKEIASMFPEPLGQAFRQALKVADFVALLPIVEKMREHDFKGAVALIPSVPVVKLLMKMNEGVAREMLRTIFMAKELQAVAETTLSSGPEALHAPMAELQTFCRRIETEGGMSAEELQQGLGNMSSSFTALASAGIDFTFPQDLVAEINPAEVLRMFANALPEPLHAHRRTMINALDQQFLDESGNVLEILRDSISDGARSVVAVTPNRYSSLNAREGILLPGEAE